MGTLLCKEHFELHRRKLSQLLFQRLLVADVHWWAAEWQVAILGDLPKPEQ